MAAKKGAKDPLTSLEDTPVARKKTSQSNVVEQPTPHAQPVGKMLEALEAQAQDTMPSSFFDDGATTKPTPVRKRMRSEVGTISQRQATRSKRTGERYDRRALRSR